MPEKEHEEAPDQIPEEHNRISTGGGECEKNCSNSTKRTAAENTLVRGGGAPPHLQITLQTKKIREETKKNVVKVTRDIVEEIVAEVKDKQEKKKEEDKEVGKIMKSLLRKRKRGGKRKYKQKIKLELQVGEPMEGDNPDIGGGKYIS